MTGEKGTDSWGCIAYAIEKSTGELCEGMEITIAMAKAEGWYATNPKWKNIPELMLRYRAASWFIRTTDPGVMMGFQTTEEAEDVYGKHEEEEVPFVEVSEAAIEAEQNANKEEIVVPESAGAEEEQKRDDNPSAEPERKEASKPKGEKPIGEAPTPDLFK